MSERVPIPQFAHANSIGVGAARREGLSEHRLRSAQLFRPFRGVRAAAEPSNHLDRVLYYAPRLKPQQAFCGASAAVLFGLPLPPGLEAGPVQLAVPHDAHVPSTAGVVGRRVRRDRLRTFVVSGVPVTVPALTLFTLAGKLGLDEMITAGDALVATSDSYPGLRLRPPLSSREALREELVRAQGFPGVGTARAALDEIVDGVESPMETATRLLLWRSGFRGLLVNQTVYERGVRIGRPDLADLLARVGVEYDGDEHRTSRARWQVDVDRRERFAAAGWRLVHVTYEMLMRRPETILERVRAAYLANGFRG